ncbi:thioredoxin [Halieaceae bacterium IMCC14734]|uniref:Thioredoxin n=1 Tax=Candidatus Litorirhabdus singularis TaxID=2518993 RepID=A0ABT3TLR6_9GAMM|nr:thioredoxin [Candidatus Litorirhabdus singularis]MCX2983278.1 thioredoxin [Candidatus Litorirhabdus singularis]
MSEFSVDITVENAQQILIEESMTRPVVVDVWAEWCEPCKTLMPLLDKLADEYQGQFLLAKLNADDHQDIAQQLGVRSLPTVLVIKEGQPVDGFVGAKPESEIREVLDKYLPKPWDLMLQQAQAAMEAGELETAMEILKQAYDDSNHQLDITLSYVQVLIELNRLDQAELVLGDIRMADQDAIYEQLKAQIELKREAARSPEMKALEQQLEQNPDDAELLSAVAVQYSDAGLHKEAMASLIKVLEKDRDHADGKTRKLLLDIIASLGKGDPLAVEFQRKLFGLMY